MPRLFTKKHRSLNVFDHNDPRYHGHEAEAVYIKGMAVLSDLNYAKDAIRFKRMDLTLKHNRKYVAAAYRVKFLERKTIPELRAWFIVRAAQLKQIRLEYTRLHQERHKSKRRKYETK